MARRPGNPKNTSLTPRLQKLKVLKFSLLTLTIKNPFFPRVWVGKKKVGVSIKKIQNTGLIANAQKSFAVSCQSNDEALAKKSSSLVGHKKGLQKSFGGKWKSLFVDWKDKKEIKIARWCRRYFITSYIYTD